MPDYRLQWLEDCVYEHLGISREDDPDLFQTFLYSEGGANYNRLNLFLSTTRDDCDIAIAMYTELKEEFEEFEVEIDPNEDEEEEGEIADEVIVKNSSAIDNGISEVSLASYVSETDHTAKVSKKKKKEKNKDNAKLALERAAVEARAAAEAAAAAAAAAETAASDEDEQPRTRIVIRSVWRTYLYMVNGDDLSFDTVSIRPCLIFIRRYMESAVPEVRDRLGQDKIMKKHFEVALMNGDVLKMLDELLGEVYQPLLAYFEHRQSYIIEEELKLIKKANATKDDDDDDDDQQDEKSSSRHGSEDDTASKTVTIAVLRDEFLMSIRKFKGAAAVAFNHLSRKVKLIIPPRVDFQGTDDEYLLNDALQKKVEKICVVWFTQVGLGLTYDK